MLSMLSVFLTRRVTRAIISPAMVSYDRKIGRSLSDPEVVPSKFLIVVFERYSIQLCTDMFYLIGYID